MSNSNIAKAFLNIYDFFLNLYSIFFVSLIFTDYSFVLLKFHNKFSLPFEDISNISVQTIILIFLLAVRYLIHKDSFLEIKFIKAIKNITKLNDKVILVSIFSAFLIIFLSMGIARHTALSSGMDLTVTDQAIYNTTKGDTLFSSLDGNINHLGAHFEPILFLIVPLYMLWPNVTVLIFLKSLFLGLAIFPLYLIAKNRLGSRSLIFAFIFAYFFSRSVRGIGFLDFHTEAFLVPLAFLSFYLLIKNRISLFILSLFFMLLCKENVAFIIIGFGIFIVLVKRQYKLGLFLFVLGISAWVLLTRYIIPHFANSQDYPYLTWLPFGKTYLENLSAVIKNPHLLIELFLSKEKIVYYLKLFGPLGFLSFLSPGSLLLVIVPLLTHIAGSLRHTGMQTISSHYPAHTMPFIFISAIYGVGWLVDHLSKVKNSGSRRKSIAFWLSIFIITVSLLFFGKSDGHKFAKFIRGAEEIRAQEKISYLKLIPKDASVYTVHNLGPHLSHRKYIYLWQSLESTKFITEYIVLDRELLGLDEHDFFAISQALNKKGYEKTFFDRFNSFHIYFNSKIEKSLLEKQPKKIIFFDAG
ncbi:MAG: DUF2079 domain-containing protein [Candidatus Omnitrophica bacterium]|nr:DUF2079 domain-containing protein [Candidatus Omnitrophota bacterium]